MPAETPRPPARPGPRGDDAVVAVAADVRVVLAARSRSRPRSRARARHVALPEPRVVVELDQEVGHLVELGAVEELLAAVHGGHDALAGGVAQVERALGDLVADALVVLAGLDDALRLAPAHVDHDVAERAVRERARLRPVDHR